MRGEVFPVLKGRGFRSSSVPGCEPPADLYRSGRQAENLPEKASFNFSRNLVADNLLAKSPAVYQICLSSKFFCHPRLNTIEFTVDQVVEILPADVLDTFHFLENRLVYESVDDSI